ncbi:hypothetical protein Bcep18194_A3797 [Burkholderia lata]|uniref:Uncharacterized protein n=1 Tax=Burkholderia lata (strain ATCC 17760 / DSM 23089 / LMG 22485 / NCIMB 9086 / R18194 / 383) TaxID=482957 RepID=Q39JG8_BURL3|nr:hypothetical protein Bcep18194_A3797 [Burkholderia lata]
MLACAVSDGVIGIVDEAMTAIGVAAPQPASHRDASAKRPPCIVCQSRPEPAPCHTVGLRFPARLTILRTFRLAPLVVRASQRRRAAFGPTAVPPGARTRSACTAAGQPHRGSSRLVRQPAPSHPFSPAPRRFPGRHPEPARRGLSLFRLCFVP